MKPVRNLEGIRFGRLIAISVCGRDNNGRAVWICKCDCGEEKKIPSRHLVNSAIKSCGCLSKETAANNGKIGGVKLIGALSHLYKHDLTEKDRLSSRNIVQIREWRKSVYERDKYTCQVCGDVGEKLNAHHLNCWAAYPDDRLNTENGITMCKKHHKEFHTYMGGERNPCTKEDYQEFKAVWYIQREISRSETQ